MAESFESRCDCGIYSLTAGVVGKRSWYGMQAVYFYSSLDTDIQVNHTEAHSVC